MKVLKWYFGKSSRLRAQSIPFVSDSRAVLRYNWINGSQNYGSSSRYLNAINLVVIYVSLSRLSILIYDDKKSYN